MRSFLLFSICLCLCGSIFAQQRDSLLLHRKLAPHLRRISLQKTDNQSAVYWITTTHPDSLKAILRAEKWPVIIEDEFLATGLIIIRTTPACLQTKLLPLPMVTFADAPRTPREELILNSFDNTANQVNILHHLYPALNGTGLTVSVKENKPDTSDIDLKGRYLPTPLSSPDISSHASIMSTIIGGGGNSDFNSKGVAWGVQIASSNFASLLPDANNTYQQYHITVQNHSYGTGIENYYGADAAAYDASALTNPSLVHVFSAGNSGNLASAEGRYKDISNVANITGSFKMGKNMITVGAINSAYTVETLSSRGPAYDGRLKPDLVAFGEDGSSGAAAIVSGAALLLQQAYRDKTSQLPPASLVKSLLLTGADDAGTPGIDYATGFGKMNCLQAMLALLQNRYSTGSLLPGETQTIPLTIPAGIGKVKVTLSWYDPPATANAPKALTNDLDVQLLNAGTGESWQPWVLNTFPHKDSLLLPAIRKQDTLNTNEQITLDQPAPGNYTIQVHAKSLATATQAYSVSWQLDTTGRFSWYHPTAVDNIPGGEVSYIRWASTFGSGISGSLHYSVDSGHHWNLVADNIDLSKGFYAWPAPALFTTALLKMHIGAVDLFSDTFTISSRLKAGTGFNCTDSFLLSWNKPADVDSFAVFALGEKYLSPILSSTDSMVVLKKASSPSLFYTVAPWLAGNRTGAKAYTFNYTTQGVACFIKSFLADYTGNNSVSLLLELGTLHGIAAITMEKQSAAGFVELEKIEPINSLTNLRTDNKLLQGANTYRVKILLKNGMVVYSKSETVYYLGKEQFIVFPNPVKAGLPLQILSTNTQQCSITLYNATGRQVATRQVTQFPETLSLPGLPGGIYFYQIRTYNTIAQTGKLVIW